MSKTYYIVTYKAWRNEEQAWLKTSWCYTSKKEAVQLAKNLSKYGTYQNIHVIKVTANEEIEF